jgi:hypothetical protein
MDNSFLNGNNNLTVTLEMTTNVRLLETSSSELVVVFVFTVVSRLWPRDVTGASASWELSVRGKATDSGYATGVSSMEVEVRDMAINLLRGRKVQRNLSCKRRL